MNRVFVQHDPVTEKATPVGFLPPPLRIETYSNTVLGHDEQYNIHPVDTESEIHNKGACVLIGGNTNFGHWVFEHLTKFAVVERFKDMTMSYPLAVWDDIPARYWSDLRSVGLNREIRVVKPGLFDCALVPTCPFGRTQEGVYAWPESVHWLRHRFPRSHGDRLIYAVRTGPKRRIINQDEVEDLLRSFGFEFIKFAEHSFLEQIKIASEARLIVMPNGADAPITLWADSECGLVELNNSQLVGTWGIQAWALFNGCPYHRMVPVGHAEFRGIDTDYLVDARGLKQAVEKMLA